MALNSASGSPVTQRSDKRRSVRRVPDSNEPLARVRLRAGRELDVVDVSDAGMLVEGAARLLPGTNADVHVTTARGRVLVRSRVVRAYVCEVQAGLVRYRGALSFDRVVDTAAAGYAIPGAAPDTTGPLGSAYPRIDSE